MFMFMFMFMRMWRTHTCTLGKKRAKTHLDKQINRQIEIDRLTARQGEMRERRHEPWSAHRLREEDKFFLLLLLFKLHTHTHTQRKASGCECGGGRLIDRDRQTRLQTEKRMRVKGVTGG